MEKNKDILFSVTLCLSAFFFFCLNLGHGLTENEYITWSMTGLSLTDLIENRLRAGHFPTYFLCMKYWAQAFGQSEAMLRLPSVLLTVGAAAVFYRLAADFFDRLTARYATVLFVLHASVVWTAQTARPYAGVLLCTLAAAWGLVRWWREGTLRWLALVALAAAAGFALQAAFFLAIAGLGVGCACGIASNRKKALAALGALLAPLVVLAFPTWLLAEKQSQYVWHGLNLKFAKGFLSLGTFWFGDLTRMLGSNSGYAALPIIGLLGWGAWKRLRESRAEGFPGPWIVFFWALIPWVVLVLASATFDKHTLGRGRYYMPALGGILLVTAAGASYWGARFGRKGRAFSFAFICLLLAPATVGWLIYPGGEQGLLVKEMVSAREATVFTGDNLVLGYELRDRQDLLIVNLLGHDYDQALAALDRAVPAGSAFWLLVYSRRDDPLDKLMENPPRGFVVTKRFEKKHARGALFKPANTAARSTPGT